MFGGVAFGALVFASLGDSQGAQLAATMGLSWSVAAPLEAPAAFNSVSEIHLAMTASLTAFANLYAQPEIHLGMTSALLRASGPFNAQIGITFGMSAILTAPSSVPAKADYAEITLLGVS